MTTPGKPPTDPDEALTVRLDEEAAERTAKLGRASGATAPGAPAPSAGPSDDDAATVLDPTAWATAAPAQPVVPAQPVAPPQPMALPPLVGGTRTLGTSGAAEDATQRLDAPVPAGHLAAPVPLPTAAPEDERPLAEGELRRFGPGVPAAAAAVWHGEVEPERPVRRKGRRRLLALVLLLAVLALLAWRWYTPPLAVSSVTVATDPAGPPCGGAAVVTATAQTNGRAGNIRYRWVRSDGSSSGELVQSVPSGTRQADLVLRWTFDGHGTMQATATVEILSPGQRTAAASFTYSCP
ncbi:hypothetical protein GCM10010495_69850 [Kitasatospora herbaricolor]|uniref:hypothetical protein n=1 Tax=Kitasatospora herbaricolor TaxID=68217 RepID=UPI001748B9BD|nr:hypothetical protein [Kitasatospora herbaricolor]MDQ0306436.1 hypothetical protein [Kitasatospora herbaricolor]GGV42295.1 hypothetical protein GCM10010495_69850 [Kitasatospora herbaricolor]